MALPIKIATSASWIGTWSAPPDGLAEFAFALGCVVLVMCAAPRGPQFLASLLDFAAIGDEHRRRRLLAVTGLAAAFLSIGYVGFYLHGGPRAVEAPIYWLQGRAMSHGSVAWAVPLPTASYRGTGLIAVGTDRICTIAPPGYPLLLAVTFLVGAPMLTGPVLAGMLVLATWSLASEVALELRDTAERSHQVAALAAGLSVVCAALRRQTADTLPHAAAALAIAIALASALRSRRSGEPRWFAVAGLAIGWLASVEPRAAVAASLAVSGVLMGTLQRGRHDPGFSGKWSKPLGWALLAAAPGVVLLLVANHAATGQALVTPAAIYARAVAAGAAPRLGEPFDLAGALRVLRHHAMDIANFEPIALVAIPALVR
jgi:hypothetical protein